jgi:methylglutaconyl-CoA hydratase
MLVQVQRSYYLRLGATLARPGRWTRTLSTTPDYHHDAPQIMLEHLDHIDLPGAIVSVMTLNRPKANAMGSVMLQQLQDCLTALEDKNSEQRSRCLVLTSSSPTVFSAGADLKERATMSPSQAAAFVTQLRNTFHRISRLPIPVVASMEGVAVGGGLEIALAADIRIAAKTASMGFPETSLAIIPGAGGTQRLSRLIGMARAKDLIFTGRRIDAVTAFEYGLVQYVVETGLADRRALELAWEIARNGPVAIQAAKYAMDEGMSADTMTEALEIERHAYERVLPTSDRLEGLEAFKEKRPPVYKGE